MKEKLALYEILELAKMNRDFANSEHERLRWEKIAQLAYEGAGKPTMADIDKVKKFFTPKES